MNQNSHLADYLEQFGRSRQHQGMQLHRGAIIKMDDNVKKCIRVIP